MSAALQTILVIDDEPALRSFAEILLQDLGYAVLLADSGRAAVQLLLQDPEAVSAVLLDMTMPGMPPEDTFRQLTEIRPGLPVIVLSGELEPTVRERFGVGTIAGYISKPYTDLELEAALNQVLNQVLTGVLAEPVPSQPAAFKLARVDGHELDLVKREYLARCRQDLPKIADLLSARDFEALSGMGHSLKGSGGCFGLPALTDLGRALEISAQAGDAVACGRQLHSLQQQLDQFSD